MARERRKRSAELSDPDAGVWQGQSVARRFLSPDGLVVLVGRTARDNDLLTFKLAAPQDLWLHVGGESGSHVVVRNPLRLERLPRDTVRFAASLAALYSKARSGGRVTVHATPCSEVYKPKGLAAGKVVLKRFTRIQAYPLGDAAD